MPLYHFIAAAKESRAVKVKIPLNSRIKAVSVATNDNYPMRVQVCIGDGDPASEISQEILEGIICNTANNNFYRSVFGIFDLKPSGEFPLEICLRMINHTSSDQRVHMCVVYEEDVQNVMVVKK